MYSPDVITTLNTSQVLVFKSDIETRMEAMALCTALRSVPGIQRCSIDLEDCDHVLRVQGNCLDCPSLVRIVRDWGVRIEELAD